MSVRCLLVVAIAPLMAGAGEADAVKKDLAAFQGKWKIQWIERDGEKTELVRDGFFTVRGKTWLIDDKEMCSLEIDPSFSPKLLDLTALFGPGKGKKAEGIYKIENDLMLWCWYGGDRIKQRPVEFKTERGSERIVYALKRVKQ